jgi:hypothetical protein
MKGEEKQSNFQFMYFTLNIYCTVQRNHIKVHPYMFGKKKFCKNLHNFCIFVAIFLVMKLDKKIPSNATHSWHNIGSKTKTANVYRYKTECQHL